MIKICAECTQEFNTNHKTMRFCNEVCREKWKVNQLNLKWATTEEKVKEKQEPNNFHTGYAYKKTPAWMKKYKVMRG